VNAFVTLCFFAAGALEESRVTLEASMLDPRLLKALYPDGPETPTEPVILRLFLLVLMTACVYGVQVLFQRDRLLEEESREAAQRQQQLESAGRLAAEIAHQLKNPLGIINNAAYTLQRTVREGKTITQQIQIIREEVDRSDRIITELMGYARLVEGRVEKLDVVEELEAAVNRVFPPAVEFEAHIHRDYAPALPALLMQRTHLSEILINILHNAREALQGRGNLWLSARVGDKYSVRITIADDGPGIAAEVLDRVFEAYYTTREKGSGLGLAIVKHNVELYGGQVSVESVLGQGAKFILEFPAKSVMRLRR
jgi:signal transduction histidine kinase